MHCLFGRYSVLLFGSYAIYKRCLSSLEATFEVCVICEAGEMCISCGGDIISEIPAYN